MSIRKGLTVLSAISVVSGGSLFVATSHASAWATSESAKAECVDGHIVIKATFTNMEPEGESNSMNVSASVHGTPMSPAVQVVPAQESKSFTLETGFGDILPGEVSFDLSWSDGHPGTDSRRASFTAYGPCVSPPEIVEPEPPQFGDPTCTASGWYMVPNSVHADYFLQGEEGTFIEPEVQYTASGTVDIMARAKEGYGFQKSYNWQHTFPAEPSDEECNPPVPTEPPATPPVSQPEASVIESIDCAAKVNATIVVNRDGLEGDIVVVVNGHYISGEGDTFEVIGFEQPLDIHITIGDTPVPVMLSGQTAPPAGSCNTPVPTEPIPAAPPVSTVVVDTTPLVPILPPGNILPATA